MQDKGPQYVNSFLQCLNRQIIPLMVGLFSFGLFGCIFYFRVWTDIQLHLEAVEQILLGNQMMPGHFLFFSLLALLAFGQANMYVLAVAGALLLAVSMSFKYQLSHQYLDQFDKPKWISTTQLSLISIALLLVFSLPGTNGHMLGQFTPNVWHNSTMIFLMPVVIVLFVQSAIYLTHPDPRKIKWLVFWVVLNVLIKPSFFICLLPVFSLAVLWKYSFKPAFWRAMIPMGIGTLILLLQYIYIYEMAAISSPEVEGGIAIKPFYTWRLKSDHLLWSFIASVAFPLAVAVFHWQACKKSPYWRYAIGIFGVAMVIMILVAETGTREFHGNYRWQALIANFLLFMVSLGVFLPKMKERSIKNWIIMGLFSAHLLSGLVYIAHMFVLKTSLF